MSDAGASGEDPDPEPVSEPEAGGPARRAPRVLANPGGIVYGTIAVAALLAAESARRETFAETTGAVAITIVLYWLAHSYAEFTGERVRAKRAFSAAELIASARHEVAVLIGGIVPLLVVIVFWIAGAGLGAAIRGAVWSAALLLVLIEYVSGRRAGLQGRELAGQTGVGALLGLAVLALRVLLH